MSGVVKYRVKCIEKIKNGCIGNHITYGKIYDVLDDYDYFTIINDFGQTSQVFKSRFERIDDPDTDYDESNYRDSDI